jgi:hypothetical protein
MRVARNRSKAPVERDDLVDTDVPAAVVCAHCGDADCGGCRNEQTRSGVVAIVAWERPGAPAIARLWATARATTFESDRFFESLPDGPIAPALRFAFASELLASAAMVLLAIAPAALIAPRWVKHVLLDEAPAAARLAAIGVPALATLLVAADGRSIVARGAQGRAGPPRARCVSVSTRPVGTWSSARWGHSSSPRRRASARPSRSVPSSWTCPGAARGLSCAAAIASMARRPSRRCGRRTWLLLWPPASEPSR